MIFVNGSAASLTDLLTAIQNACTSNGWSLAGNVLYKGTCYVEIKIVGTLIQCQGGTGVDGSNNLTGRADTAAGSLGVSITKSSYNGVSTAAFGFPVVYDVHIGTAPDEVYVVVNYGVNLYQTLAFGQSSMPGLSGSGNWYCGLYNNSIYGIIQNTGEATYISAAAAASLFCRSANKTFGVHHALDSATWVVEGSYRDWASLINRQPNQWNQESILVPIRVYATRPSGFVSPVMECAHARFVSIANLQEQQIITLGADRWKVYPWWLKSTRVVPSTQDGSGLNGHAIRYGGP